MGRRWDGANWTAERKEILRTMAMTHSASKIAEALGDGFTRNMVIGKCRRMGVGLEGIDRLPRHRFLPGHSVRPGPRPRVAVPEVMKKPAPASTPITPPIEKRWKPGGILFRCGFRGAGW